MNLKIKFRESFRPFAPIVLQEYVHEYFEMTAGTDSPYMLLVAPVQPHRCLRDAVPAGADSLSRPDAAEPPAESGSTTPAARRLEEVNERRSDIPAVTHVDYSARVQTIDRERNPLTWLLLQKFREKTGCPVMINTSFNVRSEPIVCTPEDACRCFMMTDMDVLVLGHHILLKTSQPNQMTQQQRDEHLNRFQLD
ncbi:MAG: hypothetical protein KDA89_10305, partial [Planctomycetaceae bacterium]|nr:hypothetical protein [Planctomycetaceae bacterium]